MHAILVVTITTFALPLLAETETKTDESPPKKTWSASVAGTIGPLEDFPRGGISLSGLYHFNDRIRLGGRGVYYIPRSYGNVTRHAFLLEVRLETMLLNTRFINWYLGLDIGFGFFHDDLKKVYDDVTAPSAGLTVDTGIEINITPSIRPFLGLITSIVNSP
jgi:hypothetical protein